MADADMPSKASLNSIEDIHGFTPNAQGFEAAQY
jgi:hypothetical protein